MKKKQYSIDRTHTLERLQQEYESRQVKQDLKIRENELILQKESTARQRSETRLWLLIAVLAILSTVFFFFLYRKNKKLSALNRRLLEEQGHRVRNHLQIAGSLLRAQSHSIPDVSARQTLRETDLHMQAIALLQKEIYPGDEPNADIELASYISRLTESVLLACGSPQIEKKIELNPVHVSPAIALPIALILNELITNACKYAFNTVPNPQLIVLLKAQDRRIRFEFGDNGPGFSIDQKRTSFGLRLIDMQARQLKADYRFEQRSEGGSRFVLMFGL